MVQKMGQPSFIVLGLFHPIEVRLQGCASSFVVTSVRFLSVLLSLALIHHQKIPHPMYHEFPL
jgi:hypothetical protein